MTSKVKYMIPACLMVALLSLSFANVAFADDPVWRESNNLYGNQMQDVYIQGNAFPYRIYFYRNLESSAGVLEAGQSYTISYETQNQVDENFLQVYVNGELITTRSGGNVFTFTLPSSYEKLDLFLISDTEITSSDISDVMLNSGSSPLPYEPYYSGFRFDFAAIATTIGQFVQPVVSMILPYIFLMIALIIGINAGIRVFRKTAT